MLTLFAVAAACWGLWRLFLWWLRPREGEDDDWGPLPHHAAEDDEYDD